MADTSLNFLREQAPVGGLDFYTYGYGPEFRFFNRLPVPIDENPGGAPSAPTMQDVQELIRAQAQREGADTPGDVGGPDSKPVERTPGNAFGAMPTGGRVGLALGGLAVPGLGALGKAGNMINDRAAVDAAYGYYGQKTPDYGLGGFFNDLTSGIFSGRPTSAELARHMGAWAVSDPYTYTPATPAGAALGGLAANEGTSGAVSGRQSAEAAIATAAALGSGRDDNVGFGSSVNADSGYGYGGWDNYSSDWGF